MTKDDAWKRLLQNVTLYNNSPHVITAQDIKKIGMEPRLMTYHDKRATRPRIFKELGLFVLPANNSSYYVIQGDGYNDIDYTDPIAEYIETFDFPFTPLTLDYTGSEMANIDRLYIMGVIHKFLGAKYVLPTIRGRRFASPFKYRYKQYEDLLASGIQYEVDQGFETESEIVLFEAKNSLPSDFLVRQLYFPYRVFKGSKPVKNVFMAFDKGSAKYHLFEYTFADPEDYASITKVNHTTYKITVTCHTENPFSHDYNETANLDIALLKNEVPQADNVNRIIEFPNLVLEGYNDSALVAEYFQFDTRQSSYYRRAAESLGLVTLIHNKYVLTDLGKEYAELDSVEQKAYFAKSLLASEVIRLVLDAAWENQVEIDKDFVEQTLEKYTSINKTTQRRRASTVLAMIRWLNDYYGGLVLDGRPIIVAKRRNDIP